MKVNIKKETECSLDDLPCGSFFLYKNKVYLLIDRNILHIRERFVYCFVYCFDDDVFGKTSKSIKVKSISKENLELTVK